MHLERSYQQLTLVDDAGKKHNLCELLAKACKEVTCHTDKEKAAAEAKEKAKTNADSNAEADGAEGSKPGTDQTGTENRKEADPKGAASGGKSPSRRTKKAGTSRKNGNAKKASKGASRKA